MMNWIAVKQNEAVEKVRAELSKPLAASCEDHGSVEDFDPWGLFPYLYGSYSSDFDDMALEVFGNIQKSANRDYDSQTTETLAHQMFREMLCTSDLCDYGSSPRVCFATEPFKAVLPELIEKWRAYAEMMWAIREIEAVT